MKQNLHYSKIEIIHFNAVSVKQFFVHFLLKYVILCLGTYTFICVLGLLIPISIGKVISVKAQFCKTLERFFRVQYLRIWNC
jgi:hypothetical protein